MSPSSSLSSPGSVSEDLAKDVQDWFVDNFLDGETQLIGGPNSVLEALGVSNQVCGGLPSLVTRSSAAAPNGACPELFTAVNASCTCLSGYDNVSAWAFLVRSKSGEEEAYPLTQTADEVLEIDAIQTLYVPATLQKLSIYGVGDAPVSLTFVGEYRNGAGNELPIANTLGNTSGLTTVELKKIDMYSGVKSISSFMPSTTTSLTMRDCNITQFGFEFTKGLNSLTYLDFSVNNMASVYAGTPLPNLASRQCSISLCGLEEYNLSYNKLSTFPTTAFDVATLQKFYIQGNEIMDFTVNKTVLEKIMNLTAFASDLPDDLAECIGGRWQTAHDSKFCVTPGDEGIPGDSSATLLHVLTAVCIVVAMLAIVLAWHRLASRKDRKSEHESGLSSFSTGRHLYSIFTDHNIAFDAHQTMRVQLLSDPIMVTNRLDLAEVKIERCISRGGFGLVFAGSYRGRKVAVKKINGNAESEASQIAQFIREITLMATLSHNRIVQFIGVAWEAMIDLSAVTELMERGDLITVLHNCKRHSYHLSWSDHKSVIALHIAEALVYLHSLSPKVIHRDLKSKNVLVNADMEAKLSDFGIARERYWEETHMTACMGTSFWIAPEVLLGRDYDEKADIYSFGVVLSEIDTNDYPYWNAQHPPQSKVQEGELLQQVALGEKRPAFSASCPPAVLALAQRCLQQSPEARPSAMELASELEELVLDLVED